MRVHVLGYVQDNRVKRQRVDTSTSTSTSTDDAPRAILSLTKREFDFTSPLTLAALCSSHSSITCITSNDIYGTYDAVLAAPECSRARIEMIVPAEEHHIRKYEAQPGE